MNAFETSQVGDKHKQAEHVGTLQNERISQEISHTQVPSNPGRIVAQQTVDEHFGSLALIDAGAKQGTETPRELLNELPLALKKDIEIAAAKKANDRLTDEQALQELRAEYSKVKQHMEQEGYKLGLQWAGNTSEKEKCYNLASVMGNEIINDKQTGHLPGLGTAVIGMDTIHQGETSIGAFWTGNGEHNFIEVDAKLADGKVHKFFADPWSNKTFTENENSITHGAEIRKGQFLYSPA